MCLNKYKLFDTWCCISGCDRFLSSSAWLWSPKWSEGPVNSWKFSEEECHLLWYFAIIFTMQISLNLCTSGLAGMIFLCSDRFILCYREIPLSYHRLSSVVTRYYQSHYSDIRFCFLLEKKCSCRPHSVHCFKAKPWDILLVMKNLESFDLIIA